MIALWTQDAESSASDRIPLRDVAETLQISEFEAAGLLAGVRGSTAKPKRPLQKPLAVVLYFLLAYSLVVSSASTYYLTQAIQRGVYTSEANEFALVLSVFWTFGWLVYYRRPLARMLGGFALRLRNGPS